MRLAALSLTLLSVVAFVACGSGRTAAPSPLAPRVYLARALDLMQANAAYRPKPGWKAVAARARNWWAAGATSPEGTYGAIRYVVEQLRQAGDLHAAFLDPSQIKAFDRLVRTAGTTPTPPLTISLLDGRLGVISLPGIASLPNTPSARRYARRALSGISALERTGRPCGWIVDLRDDTGGDMGPMLLGVGPILGDGRFISFRNNRGLVTESDSYRNGSITVRSAGGTTRVFVSPVKLANLRPLPPVAVLIGPNTASAGEAVTVAFRGRSHTRSFGLPTAGAPNGPGIYRLADGAAVRVSVALDVDRQGHGYRRALDPDVRTADAEAAAERWLLSTAACTQKH